MVKRLSYPIKYAIMPIYDRKVYDFDGVIREYKEVKCYILSKCYLVCERKVYDGQGSFVINYEVFFLFNSLGERENILYNSKGDVLNLSIVQEVFDSEEVLSARKLVNDKREELLSGEIICLPLEEYMKRVEYHKEKFWSMCHKYDKVEQRILEDMDYIVDSKKLKKLI